MKKVVQLGWENSNELTPRVLMCGSARRALGVEAVSVAMPADPSKESEMNCVVKVIVTRAGIVNSQLAYVDLQFLAHVNGGFDKVTVNNKLADNLDLDIGSDVDFEKPSHQEALQFVDTIASQKAEMIRQAAQQIRNQMLDQDDN